MVHSDPETFASLSLLDRRWHDKSNSSLLYGFHLTRLQSSPQDERLRWDELKDKKLPRLRQTFAQEARRRLYAAYRPRHRTFRFVAESTISPTSAPHGESLGFWLSASAAYMVVSSSTRMYMVDIRGTAPEITKEVKLQRRPTAVAITDDGHKLAVLSSETRLNIYELRDGVFRLSRSCLLEESGKGLSFAPDATVLAIAEAHAIEIIPTATDVLLTSRRKIHCQDIDNICFSKTGTTIIGTSVKASSACTVVVTVSEPMDAMLGDEDGHRRLVDLWTSQPLFPESFNQTTHATPLQSDGSTLVAYDAPAKLFGLLDSKEVQFKHPILSIPHGLASFSTPLPAVDEEGGFVSVVFNGSGIHIAAVPQGDDLAIFDPPPVRHLPTTHKFMAVRWAGDGTAQPSSRVTQRLVAIRSAALSTANNDDVFGRSSDSGHVEFLDFAFHATDSTGSEDILIELPCTSQDSLDEDHSSLDLQAASLNALSRSRDGNRPKNPPVARSVTSARRRGQDSQPNGSVQTPAAPINADQSSTNAEPLAPEELHLDDPYTVGQPRSRATLQRAATAVANRRRRPLSQTLGEFVLRRTNGRNEIPDESDADNWVPPPPQYSKDAESELPDRLKRTLLPHRHSPFGRLTASSPSLLLDQGESDDNALHGRPGRPESQARRNTRDSILSGFQGVRRAFSGPVESIPTAASTEAFPSFGPSDPAPSEPREEPERPGTSPLARPRPNQQAARPASMAMPERPHSRRNSLLQRRPLSLHVTNMFSRSASHPGPTSTPPSTSPAIPQPESPAAPSPTQIESLHRRHTSGSISSLRSEGTAPRAAAGAHRRTPGQSPWSSQIMLMSVSEHDSANPESAVQTNGKVRAPTPSASRDGASEISSESRAKSKSPSGIPRSRPQSKRLSRLPGALSTIDSVSSVITSVRSNKSSNSRASDGSGQKRPGSAHLNRNASNAQRSTGQRPHRNASQRLQRGSSKLSRGPSRAKRSATTNVEETKKQSLFRRVKRAVWKNLTKV